MGMRLIDADTLMERLKFKRKISEPGLFRGLESAMAQVKKAPTVEVVRCKDCKYFVDGDTCFNNQWWNDDFFTYVKEDDFCSYGERREGE